MFCLKRRFLIASGKNKNGDAILVAFVAVVRKSVDDSYKSVYFRLVTILKPTDLKSDVGGVLDRAINAPQYVMCNGQLLVIKKADVIGLDSKNVVEVDWNDFLDQPRRTVESFDAVDEIRAASRR